MSKRSFYKTYKRQNGKKVYQGSISPNMELSQNKYLGGVACFVIDEADNVMIEQRGNTKITAGELDLCSGHIDNNETPTQAMIREYIEELHNGSKEEQEMARIEAMQNLKKLDELDLIFSKKINDEGRRFYIQFYALRTKLKDITIQKEEVDSIKWIPIQEVFEMIRQGKTKFPYDARFEKIFSQVEQMCKQNKKEEKEL